ncbi:MAG: HlyD family secretion protein [Halanaerobiales bacterium]|nr:HlyD family secretion protein [Halanaerobiales bacterium]
MKYKYLDINNLTKKKYQKNSKNKLFLKLTILIVLLIIIIAIIWMFFGEIDVIIETSGVIKYRDNISTIYSIEGGILSDIIPESKLNIKKGDLLFDIESSALIRRKEYLSKKISADKNEIADLKFIKDYLKSEQENRKVQLNRLQNEYNIIKNKINNLKANIHFKENELEIMKKFKSVSVSVNEYKKEKRSLEDLKYKFHDYKSGKILEIEERITKLEDNILTNKIEIANIKNKLSNYKITAPISGELQFLESYNKGDYIPPGKKIMKIIPDQKQTYYVELLIKNKDILRIEKNDLVRYRIASYPYKEFGVAEGRILKINSEATRVNNKNYVYKIKASITDYLSKGENTIDVNYKNGMITKASIVASKRKIIYYVLEKLDFLN